MEPEIMSLWININVFNIDLGIQWTLHYDKQITRNKNEKKLKDTFRAVFVFARTDFSD